MRRLGRWFLGLLVVIAGAVVTLYGYTTFRFNHRYDIASRNLTLPTDSASLARGQRLATTFGKCIYCHGADLGGQVFINDKAMGYIVAPNLTGGGGSPVASWSAAEWDQAIRHGVGPTQRGLAIMPAHGYQYFTDADAAALIAYLKSLPKVDRSLPGRSFGPLARMLYIADKLPIFGAAHIVHDSVGVRPPMPEGEYIARTSGCHGCHGATLAGGPIPGMPPGTPPAGNISVTGMIKWTLADFTTALRTGKRPDGSQLSEVMPWKLAAGMTDAEIEALWIYLRSTGPTS
jgi:mono/diheme cytochrome c family protein